MGPYMVVDGTRGIRDGWVRPPAVVVGTCGKARKPKTSCKVRRTPARTNNRAALLHGTLMLLPGGKGIASP